MQLSFISFFLIDFYFVDTSTFPNCCLLRKDLKQNGLECIRCTEELTSLVAKGAPNHIEARGNVLAKLIPNLFTGSAEAGAQSVQLCTHFQKSINFQQKILTKLEAKMLIVHPLSTNFCRPCFKESK